MTLFISSSVGWASGACAAAATGPTHISAPLTVTFRIKINTRISIYIYILMHIVYNSWLHDAVICSYSDELGMMILA
jgi:hypothetical protein